MWGQDGYTNLWLVLKCRLGRSGCNPASISFNQSGSKPQPSQPIIYVLIDLTSLNPSLPTLNVYITSTFISVGPVRSAAILSSFSPDSEKTHAHSSAKRRFILSSFVSISCRNFYHGWFIAHACAVYSVPRRWSRA